MNLRCCFNQMIHFHVSKARVSLEVQHVAHHLVGVVDHLIFVIALAVAALQNWRSGNEPALNGAQISRFPSKFPPEIHNPPNSEALPFCPVARSTKTY